MIYIDPSELRETSKLKDFISDMVYKSLPNLEAATGADIMVSPDGLPPAKESLIKFHISQGAKLIQIKFGHDLSSSIVDDRLNEALSRMLSTGAQSWQCLLSFVGSIKSENEMAIIDGQSTYTDHPMTWKQLQSALTFWSERGGTLDFPLNSGKLIPEHLAIHQNHINRFRQGEKERIIWPKLPALYDEIENADLSKEWYQAQEIKPIDDIRNLIRYIPDCRIGPKMAMAIGKYMGDNEIRLDWSGFMSLLQDDKILEVPGIGKKTFNNIMWGLYRTKEERMSRNE